MQLSKKLKGGGVAGSPLVGVGNSTTRLFHLLTSSSSHQNQIKPRIGIDSQQDNKLNPIEFLRLSSDLQSHTNSISII